MTHSQPYADEIPTRRLVLRRFRHADVDDLLPSIANPNVIRMLARPPWPYERRHALEFLDRVCLQTSDDHELVRALTLDDRVIGAISIEIAQPVPTLGYWLGEPYWGNGYMSEAAFAFAASFFGAPGNDRLVSGYFTDNAASWRIQEKLGFVETGRDLVYCRPRDKKLLHVFTKLDAERYRERKP